MRTYAEQELLTKITELENRIGSRASEFIGEIGDFQWFLKQGIAKELHSMTTTGHEGSKPNLREFENIMFNIVILYDMFDLLNERELLESDYDNQCKLKS
ncbi:hypothetical protein [Flavobacterium sp. GSP6]|uniref:hypothetical protein n=1 Tax=Flavobacterium sp. GSP6 TaxID=2497488 RepID=UPI000F88B556|nr:hypothetical protein [Flavobacterium sp. GSP6]RTZ05451.1 hypothetical protein EKM03_09485 [Flavobacterium sp. GSP6]